MLTLAVAHGALFGALYVPAVLVLRKTASGTRSKLRRKQATTPRRRRLEKSAQHAAARWQLTPPPDSPGLLHSDRSGGRLGLSVTGWTGPVQRTQSPDAHAARRLHIAGLNHGAEPMKPDEALGLCMQSMATGGRRWPGRDALSRWVTLFRRRGEADRAIRVHQNLLARPDLSDLDQALFALAEDFLGAGLFDRAEKLFSEIVDSETLGATALERLVDIYEREQDWTKAIDTHRQLEVLTGKKSGQIAHYYCELAEQALRKGDSSAARAHIKGTVRSPEGALRGTLIRAGIARNEGEYQEAIRLFERVLEQDRTFISEVLPDLMDCYRLSGDLGDFERYVERLRASDAEAARDIAYAAIANDLSGSPALLECIERFVMQSEVLANLINIDELRAASDEQRSVALTRITTGLRALALSSARYRCGNCGYSTQKIIWHCPSCKLWESIKPIQRFQLESAVN